MERDEFIPSAEDAVPDDVGATEHDGPEADDAADDHVVEETE